jgi:hypothetical protein
MSVRRPLGIALAGFAACALSFFACGLYLYWNSPRLINFLAAWIPFVLSVLFAFVPSGREMKHPWIKWGWRSGVVIIGFCWSVMLWHQQDLTDKANAKQIQDAVQKSVTDANNHSDEKIGGVQKQVETVGKSLEETKTEISAQLGKTETSITNSIGKVGKPDAPEPAKLQFSLWKEYLPDSDFPFDKEIVYQQDDGTVSVDYFFKNVSASAADSIDIWVHICAKCSFAKEPEGFEKPAGIGDQSRHRNFPSLNPGVSFQKSTVVFKVDRQVFSRGVARVGLAFSYSCKNCGNLKTNKDFVLTVISFAPGVPRIAAPKLPQ